MSCFPNGIRQPTGRPLVHGETLRGGLRGEFVPVSSFLAGVLGQINSGRSSGWWGIAGCNFRGEVIKQCAIATTCAATGILHPPDPEWNP